MEGKFISVMSFCFIQGIVFRKETCKVFGCLVVFSLPCEGVCVLLFGFGNLYLVLTFHIISGPFVSQQLQIIQTLYFKSSKNRELTYYTNDDAENTGPEKSFLSIISTQKISKRIMKSFTEFKLLNSIISNIYGRNVTLSNLYVFMNSCTGFIFILFNVSD